ncbi:Fic family protein [Ralstonia sp. 22111]|uniref:Fic family protein n=1 Tax=Ralstonia sp. 22111 TaxID=3453878 RepID=UPI003F852899
MHPAHVGGCPCAVWEYEGFDPKTEILPERCFDILVGLRKGTILPSSASDTRPVHAKLFKGLTQKECSFYAGNYRGTPNCCLFDSVVIISDGTRKIPTTPPADVASEMAALAGRITQDLTNLQASTLKGEDLLVSMIDVAMDRMTEFLAIHPYANGNGHMGRFLVWCLLAQIKKWPKKWPFDDRPPAPYDTLIGYYRAGIKDPLRQYVLGLMKK